jgi:ornithine cyclodeaminase/alanine dehydrogenase-like protein (mu-crystallin family)
MKFLSANDLDERLDFPSLIDALARAFAGGIIAPARHHHVIERGGGKTATHILMPAWTTASSGANAFLGSKIVSVFPSNAERSLPAVHGLYVLQSGETGEMLAAIDGTRLTLWRTAAASALAARSLARKDARSLLLVGSGALAPFLARAHYAVRPIEKIAIWNHRRGGAERLAAMLADEGFKTKVADNLETEAGEADVISCATLATAPLIRGQWLRAGHHVDIVGAFNLQMREVDDEALCRARIFIDTPAALTEGGDIAVGLKSGAIDRSAIVADLAGLCAGAAGRRNLQEITLFKSIGAATEDLAAAILAWRRCAPGS